MGLVFPAECVHCRREREVSVPLGAGESGLSRYLCASCEGRLHRAGSEPSCGACGGLLGSDGAGCQRCGSRGLTHVASVVRLGVYEGPLRSLLLLAKFRGQWPVAEGLGKEMSALGVPAGAEVVVPVPLHVRRMFWRGYNVADLLARGVARGSGLAWGRWLTRRRATVPQSAHSAHAARRRNVAGAFAVPWAGRVAGRHVLLVDDILTSGATATECARALKRAGATRVSLMVAAVADPRSAELEPDSV